jgi:hypothetical protein
MSGFQTCPLDQVVDTLGPLLADRSLSTKARTRMLWAAAKKAGNLGSSDVVHDAFVNLAVEVNLIDGNGRWTGEDVRESVRRRGREDAAHIIRWALRGWNPFEKGPLA